MGIEHTKIPKAKRVELHARYVQTKSIRFKHSLINIIEKSSFENCSRNRNRERSPPTSTFFVNNYSDDISRNGSSDPSSILTFDEKKWTSHQTERSRQRGPKVQWMWKSNKDPWSTIEPEEWKNFSDVENMIIEEASSENADNVVLDDYHVNLKNHVQISNYDSSKQRPVKRQVLGEDHELPLRQSRFTFNPVVLKSSFKEEHVLAGRSVFMKAALSKLDIPAEHVADRLPEIVELAALGIVAEGALHGKKCEAKWMAEQLIRLKQGTLDQIGECCAHFYTMESFLCQKLNETMRLVADEEHERIWRSKLETFGPFAIILEQYINSETTYKPLVVYRGAVLNDDMIRSYREWNKRKLDPSAENMMRPSFPAFTSCSRNREKAEAFGNVLFIIELLFKRSIDVSKISNYPDEEEELIKPGVVFIIENVEQDPETDKYLVYLSVI